VKTPIAVTRKAQQLFRISKHLMMAKYAEACSAMANFKRDLNLNLDIVAWWTVNKTEYSSAQSVVALEFSGLGLPTY
jgi:hypothetical protein